MNKKFADYTAHRFTDADVRVLDLNDYPLPIFTTDLLPDGIPDAVHAFLYELDAADGLIISLAEHNGTYTAAFKNLFDWASVVKRDMFAGKKMLLLSTSDGARAAISVMEAGLERFPHHGADIVAHFALPGFSENFSSEKGILDAKLAEVYEDVIELMKEEFVK